jgi:ankyrin repeat protein
MGVFSVKKSCLLILSVLISTSSFLCGMEEVPSARSVSHEEDIYTQILEAAGSEKWVRVLRLMRENAVDINCTGSFGEELLRRSVRSIQLGALEVTKILIKSRRVDLDCQDDGGCTPLMLAINRGSDAAELLIEGGAGVNIKTEGGQTALMKWAGRFGGGGQVTFQALMRAGALLDEQDADGRTALMRAALKKNKSELSLLLAAGANTKIQDKQGRSAIWYAAQNGPPLNIGFSQYSYCAAIVECLAQAEGRSILPALADALQKKNESLCKFYMQEIAAGKENEVIEPAAEALPIQGLINNNNNNNVVAPQVPANNKEAITEFINAENAHGETALHYAALRKNKKIYNLLLEHGAQENTKTKDGNTPDKFASEKCSICLEKLKDDLMQINCSHILHRACLGELEKKRDAICPLCRAVIQESHDYEMPRLSGRDLTPLMQAVSDGNEGAVRNLIQEHKAGGEINLIDAATQGNLARVQALIQAGAHLNIRDSSGCTPLMLAAQAGHELVIQELIAHGADVQLTNMRGRSVYGYAKNREIESIISKAIKSRSMVVEGIPACVDRIVVDLPNNSNQFEEFFDLGITGNDLDSRGIPLLISAIMHENFNQWACSKEGVARFIQKSNADVNVKRANPMDTALCWAAYRGNVACVEALLEAGADIDACDGDGYSPLICAVIGEALPCDCHNPLLPLIRAGADLDVQDNAGKTAIMHAVCRNNAYVNALWRAGANLDLQDDEGMTALMYAMTGENNERRIDYCVLDLCTSGRANPNLRDRNGRTALMHAVLNDRWGVVGPLLEAGADGAIRDNEGKTALSYAFERRYQRVINALVGGDPAGAASMLFTAIRERNLRRMRDLLNAGANVNYVNAEGETALILAASTFVPQFYSGRECRGEEVLETLIRAGANLNHQDNNGNTALMRAMRNADGAARTLIRAGADVNLRNNEGAPALMGANALMRWSCRDGMNNELLRELLQSGARVNEQDNQGRTALMFAAMWRRPDNLIGLLEAGANMEIEDAAYRTARDYVHCGRLADRHLFKGAVRECLAILEHWSARATAQPAVEVRNDNNINVPEVCIEQPLNLLQSSNDKLAHEPAMPSVPIPQGMPVDIPHEQVVQAVNEDDHLDLRFGREVILASSELNSVNNIPEQLLQPLVPGVDPQAREARENIQEDVEQIADAILPQVPVASPAPQSPRGELEVTAQAEGPNTFKWGVLGVVAAGAAYGAHKLYKWYTAYKVVDLKTTVSDLHKQVMKSKRLAVQSAYKSGMLSAYFNLQQKAGAFKRLPQERITQLNAHIAVIERVLSAQEWNEQEYQALCRLFGSLLK